MTSDKSIANSLIGKYGGADRKEVLRLLTQAAAAGKAAENNRISRLLSDHRGILGQSLRVEPSEARLKRVKIITSMRTIDALQELLNSKETP